VGPLTRGKNPNVDAVLWFITEVFPLIRQELPDAVFTVAGNNESSRVSAHAGADIRFVPRTPDLSDLYDRSRVFVAPTRFAAGIPHKIHEAAARGLPVVATKLLADQLGWIDGMELFIGSDAATFAGRCIELYRDAAAWGLLRESALKRVRSECSPDLFDNRIREILD
jgi:glycosyltransferase involved in cell wall biosynthesis